MYSNKIIALTIACIICIAMMLLIVQLLLRKLKPPLQGEKLNISFGVWFTALTASALIIAGKTIAILTEAIDNIYKLSSSPMVDILKTFSLFIGLSGLWFISWYYVGSFLSIVFVGKRELNREFQADNTTYFLVKGGLIIGFILCLSPVFEIILRFFMPNMQIPFYH